MKQSLPILAAGLAAVYAQAPASLPQCGQTCVNNMLEIAVSDFGCDANALGECACCNPDFGFGIRDCARSVCGEGSNDYSSVVSYGSSYCSSAVTSCPSGTQATSVLASATGSGASGTGASGSAATPAMTSGPLAGAVGGISTVSGSSDAYVVGSETITAGGDGLDNDGTAYTALPSGAGVLVSGGDAQTTYVPGSGSGGSSNSSGMASVTSGGGAGGLAGAVGAIGTVSGNSNAYEVGDTTISAGGSQYVTDGTTYTALPSAGGVQVVGAGATTTANPASGSGSGTSSGSGGAGGASSTSGGSGGAGGSSESSGSSGGSGGGSANESAASGESGNVAPIATAAPALIGAAAMAILAL